MWPTASDTMLTAANPNDITLQSDGIHTTLTTRIIPLPPRLAPIFLEHAHDNLPTVTQVLKTMHDTASPPTQQMCALPVQFLRTACIAAANPTATTTTSQLSITLTPVQMDHTITQWASARYSYYRLATQPTNPQQPPPNLQPPQITATPQATQAAPQGQPAGTPLQQVPPPTQINGTGATAHQVIDIQDDDANPTNTTPARTPVDPQLAIVVAESVAAAFREQHQRDGQQTPRHALEQALPDRAPAITGIDHSNLISWSGLMPGENFTPFWKVFGEATTESGRTYVLDSFLKDAQRNNNHVQYTIRPDFIRDLKMRKFHYTPTLENIHQGITPFALQKLSKAHDKNHTGFRPDFMCDCCWCSRSDRLSFIRQVSVRLRPTPDAQIIIFHRFP